MNVSGEPVEKPSYPITSVDSALRLLLMVAEKEQVRIADAAAELDVARSTAYRLMQMLAFHGFVRQDPATKAYAAGPVLFDLGLQIVRNLDVRAHARPTLESLSDKLGETVQLHVVQHHGQLVCIDAVEGDRAVRVGGGIGNLSSVPSTAPGRAVLSTMEASRIEQLFPGLMADEGSDLLEELERTRQRGYAIELGDAASEVSAIAAPILDARGHASFALTVALPASRLKGTDIAEIGACVLSGAADITDALPW